MTNYFWDRFDVSKAMDPGDPDLADVAAACGFKLSMWFPPRSQHRWMEVDGTEAIDYGNLFRVCNMHIKAAGWRKSTRLWRGQLLPTYENHWIVHSPDRNPIGALPSGLNHIEMIRRLRARYPSAQLGDYAFPYRWWDSLGPYKPGLQCFTRCSEMYDLCCPMAYLNDRPGIMQTIQAHLDWAATFDKPVYPFISPWLKQSDGKFAKVADSDFVAVLDACRATPNFAGIQWWAMIRPDHDQGLLAEPMTADEIRQHHAHMLELAA